MLDSSFFHATYREGKNEVNLTNIKVMIIQCYLFVYLFWGDLQVAHGNPLRLVCKQNLPYQKTS